MSLPRPATGVELYLAAIHDRLGELLERLGGGQAPDRFVGALPSAAQAPAVEAAGPKAATTKRTRTRTRGGEPR